VNKLLNIRPVHDWFGYTRRERRSTFILLVIILVVLLTRYVVPEKNINVVNAGLGFYDSLNLIEISDNDLSPDDNSFYFDPNSASYDTLLKIGLDSREAKTLISYRLKGGKFRKPADLRKVYGMDSIKSEKLIAHVVLPPVKPVRAESHPSGQENTRININNCDSSSLIALPGIGQVLSVRIIKYRNLLGGFARVEQLREVYGLPAETYELIRERVFADSSGVRKIKINSSDYKGLSRIPYIEKYEVTAILKYRELKGRLNSMDDLKDNKILTPEKADKVEAYIDFR
jgi:competence protein ComEA